MNYRQAMPYVIRIEPGKKPLPIEIANNFLEVVSAVNVDGHLQKTGKFIAPPIVNIKNGICIISSPEAKKYSIPVTRTIEGNKFHGILYILRLSGHDIESLSIRELVDYCIIFSDENVTFDALRSILSTDDRP